MYMSRWARLGGQIWVHGIRYKIFLKKMNTKM